MAKYRVRFNADGEAQERTVTADSKDDAIRQVQLDGGLYFTELNILEVTKLAELVAETDTPKPDAGHQGNAGRRRAAGVVKGGMARLELATRAGKPVWPPRGRPHNGIAPGKWRSEGEKDETGSLPHDCPVKPLGYDGENYYLIDTLGQVFNSGTGALGVERMQKLFAGQEDFLCWAWPSWSKGSEAKPAEVIGFKAEEARRDLFAACARKGPWNATDRVRGRGAWRDEQGRLVLHCGDHLVVDGRTEECGEVGEYFYPRRPATPAPWAEPVERAEDNPAVELFKALRTWNFVRGDLDVILFMGWIFVALSAGALEWRPSIFTVGDAGTGKSQLLKLLKGILGRLMISTTNASEAGLYQLVAHDSLPIGIDELEGEDGQAQAQKIIKMARDAASGSIRIRGGQDHKGVEFAAQSAFSFSAINPPPLPPASLTRLALLQLRPIEATGRAPVLKAAETFAPKLLRRIVDHWQDLPTFLDAYRDKLREVGRHDARGQDTFGTFLAGAHILLGDEGMDELMLPRGETSPAADHFVLLLRSDVAPELEGRLPNWLRCIEAIMTAQPDAWRSGERQTVGQIVEQLTADKSASFPQARLMLAAADIGIVPAEDALPDIGTRDQFVLAVPNDSKTLGKLLRDTSYGSPNGDGNWRFALSQAPEQIVLKNIAAKKGARADNRMTIAGFQRRCLFIDVKELKKWQDERK